MKLPLVTVTACAIVLSGVLTSVHSQAAEPYPSKPIRMVAGWPPGGGSDLIARAVSNQLSKALGQPIVFENKAGGGHSIATDFVTKSAPDGYTLQFVNANHTLAPFFLKNLPYDIERDLTGISQVSSSALVLITNPALPVKNVKELIAMAKSRPNTLNAAAGGTSGSGAVSVALFKQVAGAPYVIIPYKGGSDAMVGLLRGDAQFTIISQASSMSAIRAGKVKLLAVLSKKRVGHLPNVPTMAESGLQGLDLGPWEGVVAPAKTPAAIIERLSTEIQRAVNQPEVVQIFAKRGVEVVGSSPAEFNEHIRSQMALFRSVFKNGKIGG